MGKREDRQILREVRKLWGQFSTGPRGACDQSMERISSPISPPPAKMSFTACSEDDLDILVISAFLLGFSPYGGTLFLSMTQGEIVIGEGFLIIINYIICIIKLII
jgi:hypothetical protein